MNKMYLLVPFALLGAFLLFEQPAERRHTEKERARQEQTRAAKALEDARQAEQRRLATLAARQHAEELDRQEQDRAAKKQRDFEDLLQKLVRDGDAHGAKSDALAREVAALESQLIALREKRERVERDVFVLAQDVERQRVLRRLADLEIQRAARMVVDHFVASSSADRPLSGPATPRP